MGLFGDIVSAGLGAVNTGYNLYTNKRDFDYQKALQQKMFEREDTAVQRRMADLKAAGLNPNLAAGSAAGAGSVVARSNTNDVNMGSALDTLQALNQIKLQRQEVVNKRLEGQILTNNSLKAERDERISQMEALTNLGFQVYPYVTSDGKLHYQSSNFDKIDDKYFPLGTNKFLENLNFQNNNIKNSASLLEKQLEWYNYDEVMQLINPILGLLGKGIKPR